MIFHAYAGTPRSGSTLFGNVLNQNPEIHASATSPLLAAINSVRATFANSVEFRTYLSTDSEKTNARMLATVQGIQRGWYAHIPDTTHVFDKNRGWNAEAPFIRQLSPNGTLWVLVRDPRDILCSIEKRERENPTLSHQIGAGVGDRFEAMWQPTGMVGGCIRAIEQAIHSAHVGIHFIRYEDFSTSPGEVMERFYSATGITPFKHDFDDVKPSAATDGPHYDAAHLNKFPHVGNGKIRRETYNRREFMTPELESAILPRFPFFAQRFGYV